MIPLLSVEPIYKESYQENFVMFVKVQMSEVREVLEYVSRHNLIFNSIINRKRKKPISFDGAHCFFLLKKNNKNLILVYV